MRYACLILAIVLVGCKARKSNAPALPVDTAGWTKVDPDGDCEFSFAPTAVSIFVPAKDKDLSSERNRMNAPRVLRNSSGDFTASVRVRGDFRPSMLTTTPDRTAFLGAGLVLMADERNYIRLERASLCRDRTDSYYVNWEMRINGAWSKAGNTAQAPLADSDTWLRLTRRGNVVYGQYSQDGETWRDLEAFQVNLPEQVQVGLAAVSTAISNFRPEFDQYKSEALK